MALVRIDEMRRRDKERNSAHQTVQATYTVFSENGTRYFQLDTYGASDRAYPEKVSQSFQIDEAGARSLVELLRKESFLGAGDELR